MIRVLQVVGCLNYGGVESVIMNYYRHIDKSKIQFDFVTTSKGGRFEEEIKQLGGNIFYLPQKSRHPFEYMKQLKKVIRENNYDVVHSNTNSASAFLDLYPAKRAKVRVRIAHSHNNNCLIGWQHRILRPILPTVTTHRMACSDAAAKWLFGNNKNYKIINNGIDFDKFAYNEDVRNKVREKLNWKDYLLIGNVASFQDRKNQRFLIELMPQLISEFPNAKLVLVGAGDTQEKLKQLCVDLGIESSVEFLGVRNDVNELLQGFDVFCFPSLFEGLGVAYIEAAASSLPVVISDGVPYVQISENVEQLALDSEQWLLKIKRAFGNSLNRRSLTNEEIINSGYDIKSLAKQLEEYYAAIVKND